MILFVFFISHTDNESVVVGLVKVVLSIILHNESADRHVRLISDNLEGTTAFLSVVSVDFHTILVFVFSIIVHNESVDRHVRLMSKMRGCTAFLTLESLRGFSVLANCSTNSVKESSADCRGELF